MLIVRVLTFQTSSEVTNRLFHIILFFLGNDTKNRNISLLLEQAQEQEIRFSLIMFIDKNHFKKGKYGTT